MDDLLAQSLLGPSDIDNTTPLLFQLPVNDRAALLHLIRTTGKQKDLQTARAVHGIILGKGLFPKDICLSNALLSLYVKCGALREAEQLFDKMPERTVVSWSALIGGYVHCGNADKAFQSFRMMREGGLSPNSITFACMLKACADKGFLEIGEEIHETIISGGLMEENDVLRTAVLNMYAKCNEFRKALEVFDKLPTRDVVAWNALISGYVQHGHGVEALKCFMQMQEEGVLANETTFTCMLKACGMMKFLKLGETIHDVARKQDLIGKNMYLGNAIVHMYAKCDMLEKAEEVFHELPVRDVVTWNALISGHVLHGQFEKAICAFMQMQNEASVPDAITFICIAKACASMGCLEMGEKIFSDIQKQGLLEKDPFLGTTLVDMYAKCNELSRARELFDRLPVQNVATWNALINGYVLNGSHKEALYSFQQMQYEGIRPNEITFASVLKACANLGFLKIGERIHAEISKQGLLEKDISLGVAIMDMYGKCKMLQRTQEIFKQLPNRNASCWSAMIVAYLEQDLLSEALTCIRQMKDESISPNAVTFSYVLKACGKAGCLQIGQEIHSHISELHLLENDVILGTNLVDTYCKCGSLEKAQEAFEALPNRNLPCWTALMSGYAQVGQTRKVIYLLNEMIAEGFLPDLVTFLILLNMCSHGGLVKEGEQTFIIMDSLFSHTPTIQHYACIIDLFGRAGHIDSAITMIEKVCFSDRLQLWLSFLNTCYKCVNMKFGQWAFEQAIRLDKTSTSAYVCMGNIYATA